MRSRHGVQRFLVVLTAFITSTGVAAAQQNEISSSLTQIEQFVATTLGQLGVIVFLVGAAVWFVSRRSADRAQWGWRGMWGGAGMIALSVSYSVFVGLFENLAPGILVPVLP
ncbi:MULTISPECIES: hypothetical protein [unclassified Haladaptatus]|uniref:hypothetical protein n=1 Tax=unclassified Haladaptatus TaxID=2622732 RepID=UPI0023E80401|nr:MULTISPECIES: hypothetical protein [unclassified Haladaptatus]